MTFDKEGRLYIATGGPAAVYRVDVTKPNAQPEEFFKSDEQHIRALAWDAKGNLIAGSDGAGWFIASARRARATCCSMRRGARLHRSQWPPMEPSTPPTWARRATIPCPRCRFREWARLPSRLCSRIAASREHQHFPP